MTWSDFTGIPFNSFGSQTREEGVSCWGLVVLVYKERYGVSLPNYHQVDEAVARGEEPSLEPHKTGWEPVDVADAKEGDVLHLRSIHKGRLGSYHVGILLSGDRVLHTMPGVGSHTQSLLDGRFRNRVLGAFTRGI